MFFRGSRVLYIPDDFELVMEGGDNIELLTFLLYVPVSGITNMH